MSRDGEVRNRWENTHRWSPGAKWFWRRLQMNKELDTRGLGELGADRRKGAYTLDGPRVPSKQLERLRIAYPPGNRDPYIYDVDGRKKHPPKGSTNPDKWCRLMLKGYDAGGVVSFAAFEEDDEPDTMTVDVEAAADKPSVLELVSMLRALRDAGWDARLMLETVRDGDGYVMKGTIEATNEVSDEP